MQDYSAELEQKVHERTIALQEANQLLKQLATTDGLTQIFNRRYFDDFLNEEWGRSCRSESWLSLILCDVDHFKAYNDTYGHQLGDKCLYQVAQGIVHCTNRQTDRVTRYGGEEFAVILPNTDLDGALQIAVAIRRYLRSLKIEHRASDTDEIVTLSLGVASLRPTQEQGVIELINLADRSLYQVKLSGRDQAYAIQSKS